MKAWKKYGVGGEHRGNAGPRARDTARDQPREPPHHRGRERRDQDHRHDRTGIAGDRKRRQHDDRDAGRVNRIDLAARRSLQEVRFEPAWKVIEIIAVRVIVRDPQIEVFQNALGCCQIVRLVAAGNDATHLAERRERGNGDNGSRNPRSSGRIREESRQLPQPDRDDACNSDRPDKRFRWTLPDQERWRDVTGEERQPYEERGQKRPGLFEAKLRYLPRRRAASANTRRTRIEGSAAIRCVSPLMTATVPADSQSEMAARSATIDAATCECRSSLDSARDDPEPVEGPTIGTSSMLEAQTRAETELHAADVGGLRRAQHVDVRRRLRETHEAARAEADAVVLPHDIGRVRADVVAGLALLARRDAGSRETVLLLPSPKLTSLTTSCFQAEEGRPTVDEDVELLIDRHHPSELQMDRALLAIQTGTGLVERTRAVEDDRARNRARQPALGVVLLLMIGSADGQVAKDANADADIKQAARRERA